MYEVPAPNQRFKPRAEFGLLSSLLRDCWQEQNDALEARRDSLGIGETIAAQLESMFPPADMDVLQRYGAAESVTDQSIRIYNLETKHFDHSTMVKLPRPVMVPRHNAGLYAGGTRWSSDPTRGVSCAYRAELEAAGTWQSFCDDQDRRDAAMVDDSAWPYFAALIDARNAYQAEYRRTTDWPAERKAETGQWPTWAGIEAEFPTLGAYVARQRAARDACA